MTRGRYPSPYRSGLTLLELLIAVAVLGIVISVAMPNMSGLIANQRLIGAAEQVYGHLQQARSEAITRSTPTWVNFAANGTTTWTYGMSSLNTLCTLTVTDPATANACVIVVDDGDGVTVAADDYVLMRFTSADYEDVIMNIASFSSGTTQIAFDPVRGLATSGQVNLTSASGRLLRVTVSLLGRVAICSPDGSVQNYGTC